MHRDAWRRASRLMAVVLSVITVGLILMTYAGDIAAAMFTSAQGRFESLLVSAIRLLGYTAVFAIALVGLRRTVRAVTTKIEVERVESDSTET